MLDTDQAQRLLEENFADWVQALSPKVVQIGPEGAVLEIPVTPAIARVGGIVCGQALATLADTSMVFACAVGWVSSNQWRPPISKPAFSAPPEEMPCVAKRG